MKQLLMFTIYIYVIISINNNICETIANQDIPQSTAELAKRAQKIEEFDKHGGEESHCQPTVLIKKALFVIRFFVTWKKEEGTYNISLVKYLREECQIAVDYINEQKTEMLKRSECKKDVSFITTYVAYSSYDINQCLN